jgi:hypothetical protein
MRRVVLRSGDGSSCAALSASGAAGSASSVSYVESAAATVGSSRQKPVEPRDELGAREPRRRDRLGVVERGRRHLDRERLHAVEVRCLLGEAQRQELEQVCRRGGRDPQRDEPAPARSLEVELAGTDAWHPEPCCHRERAGHAGCELLLPATAGDIGHVRGQRQRDALARRRCEAAERARSRRADAHGVCGERLEDRLGALCRAQARELHGDLGRVRRAELGAQIRDGVPTDRIDQVAAVEQAADADGVEAVRHVAVVEHLAELSPTGALRDDVACDGVFTAPCATEETRENGHGGTVVHRVARLIRIRGRWDT